VGRRAEAAEIRSASRIHARALTVGWRMTPILVVLLACIREAGALPSLMLALAAVMALRGNDVGCLLSRPHQVAVLVCGISWSRPSAKSAEKLVNAQKPSRYA